MGHVGITVSDDVQRTLIVSKTTLDSLLDVLHVETLSTHLVSIYLKPDEPWAEIFLILCNSESVELVEEVFVRGNDSGLRVRIIVNRRVSDNLRECGVFNVVTNSVHLFVVKA